MHLYSININLVAALLLSWELSTEVTLNRAAYYCEGNKSKYDYIVNDYFYRLGY